MGDSQEEKAAAKRAKAAAKKRRYRLNQTEAARKKTYARSNALKKAKYEAMTPEQRQAYIAKVRARQEKNKQKKMALLAESGVREVNDNDVLEADKENDEAEVEIGDEVFEIKDSEDETFEVEKVIGHQIIDGRVQYRLRWLGFDETTWEYEENMDCANLISDYKRELFGGPSGLVSGGSNESRPGGLKKQ